MFLDTDYQTFIGLSRYARWLEAVGRRETFDETIKRYFDYVESFIKDKYDYDIYSMRGDLTEAVKSLKVMPSMRAMMTAGPALDRCHVGGYNCSYIPVDNIRSFDECMYILMCGTGVGFSVEREGIEKLPVVPDTFQQAISSIVVEDSKAGWCDALRQILTGLYAGYLFNWDVSKIRPAGARLMTFGGRASGPEPLEDLFKFVINIFTGAAGRHLYPLEAHDIMCKIGEIVVVGGVRRSALISLSNLSDTSMRLAKSGDWWATNGQRTLANNSAVYKNRPSMEVFMNEWHSLYESKSGERGLFNRQAAVKQVARNGRRLTHIKDKPIAFGTNPCILGTSIIQTIRGPMMIKDITEPTMVHTMKDDGSLGISQATASWVSKTNAETLVVRTRSGESVTVTPDHQIFVVGRGWVEAKNLNIGDTLVQLCRSRRGAAYSGVKLTIEDNRAYRMEHRMVYEAYYGSLGEDYDVHHKDGDTYNNDIENLEALTHSDHARLTALEQPNNHQTQDERNHYFISPPNSKHGVREVIPMPNELKSNLVNQYSTRVESISEGPVADVYDMTVEQTHNFIANNIVVHNCSEIILRPYQFCNLSEVVVRSDDTLATLKDKVRQATILGTLQSCMTDFKYLRNVWKKNTEEERLLGVSLTGIMDCKLTNGFEGFEALGKVLDTLREVAIETNRELAVGLGIPQSTAITCVKPSGTVSQLVDSASGIHPRHSPYYIRTVRADNKDPLTKFMSEYGIPNEPDVTKPLSTTVFSFPVKAPEGALCRDDVTAITHLQLWKVYARHWCEHKPSITVSVKEEEWFDVGAWVYRNFDEVSGISFLPYDGGSYRQAPYQECTKDEYDALVAQSPDSVNWLEFLSEYENEDTTTGSQELACTAGVCEVVDIVSN